MLCLRPGNLIRIGDAIQGESGASISPAIDTIQQRSAPVKGGRCEAVPVLKAEG